MDELATLAVLADVFPNRQSLYTEIIILRAILNLPRGTEHPREGGAFALQ